MNTNRLKIVIFILIALFTNCGKETITEKSRSEIAVNYCITVVQAESNSMLKSGTTTEGINAATISISNEGKTITATTDADGRAYFTNLRAGLISVKIKATNYTTANLTVDLGANKDFDAGKRNASTIVTLFATSGIGTKTISGVAYAQTDATIAFNAWSKNSESYIENTPMETAVAGTEIIAIMNVPDFKKYVSTTGDGNVTGMSYENASFKATVANDGKYSLTVPDVAKGMNYSIYPANFETLIKYSAINYLSDGSIETDASTNWKLYTKYETHVFRSEQIDVYIIGSNVLRDIVYTCAEGINDGNYKGSIY